MTWFRTVYAFHKQIRGISSANCTKPGYIV